MAMRKADPRLLSAHLSYSSSELSTRLGMHKKTIRQWQREGLAALDNKRPPIFQGAIMRLFLTKRNERHKTHCPVGTLYCLKCRAPQQPAMGMADYVPRSICSGTLKAICAVCATVMNRHVRQELISQILRDYDVRVTHRQSRFSGSVPPSLQCTLNRQV